MTTALNKPTAGIAWLNDILRNNTSLTDRVAGNDVKGSRKPLASRGYKPPSGPKREPHWLTWKTGNTPAPEEHIVPRPPSGVRPGTGASIARTVTPGFQRQTPSPDIEIIDLANQDAVRVPSAVRPPSVLSRAPSALSVPKTPSIPKPVSGQPRQQTPGQLRFQTPGPARLQTPGYVKPEHFAENPDAEYSANPTQLNGGQNPAYMPALKTWISKANDYERDVAYNLMQILSTSNGVPGYPRPRSAAPPGIGRLAAGTRRNVPHTAGVITQRSYDWQQAQAGPIGLDPPNHVTQSMQGPELYYRPPGQDQNPRVKYNKNKAIPESFTHQASCFMNSQMPYRGSYTINPEWVSEVKMWKNPQKGKPKRKVCTQY